MGGLAFVKGNGTPMWGNGTVDGLRRLGQILAGHDAGPDANWASIAESARSHGVAPLLFWQLGQGASDGTSERAAPPEVVSDLREDLYTAAAQGIRAEAQLSRVLGTLSRVGIPAIVVKGAALGAFYPDPVLRLYGDIDIMVKRDHLDAAEQALNAVGYRCFASKGWWLQRFHHLPPMVNDAGGLLVELHWRLDYEVEKGRLPSEDLWARAVGWTVRDQQALKLDDVDAALYLCRHAVVQHRVRGALRSLCDLVQLTRGWGKAEWVTLSQRSQNYGLTRPVYLMLVLGEELLGLAVPEAMLSALRASSSFPEAERLVQLLMGSSGVAPAHVSMGAVQAAADGPFTTRLKHLMYSLFLPREGMAMVYGIPPDSPRIVLAYLWRPIDLVGRYGLSAWRVLRGERGARIAWQREVWLERWLRGDVMQDSVQWDQREES
jgi:hypothetical protein